MDKSLLVTGGAGFIASNFIHYWIKKYPEDKLIILDSLSYAGNLDSIKEKIKERKVDFIKGNINDQDLIRKILYENNISHVINFAAETHVDRSIKSPMIFIETNILGTYNLLESFKEHWEKNDKQNYFRFIHISTDEVFGSLEPNENPFTEISPYKPRSPYSASKASSDHLVKAWYETYGLPTLITNCSNNYGPYQYPEKLIPLTITNILRNREIPVYGDGLNVRDWLYVEDHCEAIDLIIEKAIPGESFCIGGNNELRNIDLINKICDLVDANVPNFNLELKNKTSSKLINFIDDRLGHDKRYAIDSTKLYEKLKWRPKVNFNEGILFTIKWYLENRFWWEKFVKD